MKKAGKKSKEFEDKWGPIRYEILNLLPEDILVELIQERMKSVEFNAGAVFDNLTCSYCQDEMIAIKCIMKAIKT